MSPRYTIMPLLYCSAAPYKDACPRVGTPLLSCFNTGAGDFSADTGLVDVSFPRTVNEDSREVLGPTLMRRDHKRGR